MLTRTRHISAKATPAGISQLLPGLVSLLSVFFCIPAVEAQSTGDLQYLIFDPVLLEVEAVEEGADPNLRSYAATELTTLPEGEQVDLRSWLNSRQTFAAPVEQETLTNDIASYEQAVTTLEMAGGPYEPRLSQELLSLGSLYQEAGDYGKALEIFGRAFHINRVNNGLYNLDQLPIVEKTLESHLASGDLLAADEQQEYLFYLQRKTLGDGSIDLLPALTRYAEWNVFAFNTKLQTNSQELLDGDNVTYLAPSPINALGMESFWTRRLLNAQVVYHSIINILMSNYGLSDRRLLDFEKQLALTHYFFATSFDIEVSPFTFADPMSYSSSQVPYEFSSFAGNVLGYQQGREALERRIDYMLEMDGITPEQLAQARIDEGDWLLIFKKRMGAIDVFDEAYQHLQAANVPQAGIDALLKPPLPQQIPAFLAHPYTRTALGIPASLALEHKGFVDVEYSLNRFGSPGTVNVLGKSPETSEVIETHLVRNIRRAQFRPRYDNGVVRDSDLVRARYYYTY